MAKKHLPCRVWGIESKVGFELVTLRTTRRQAIEDYVKFFFARTGRVKFKKNWTTLRKWGYRCIPLRLDRATPKEEG